MKCCTCKATLPDGRKNKYCQECSRQKLRNWKAANPERWKELKNRSKRKKHAEDPGRYRAKYKDYYERNREAICARMREKVFVKCATCGAGLPSPQTHNRCQDCTAERNARRRALTETRLDYKAIAARSGGLCAICGQLPKRRHYDHIIPLSRGGTHDEGNVQLTCSTCNHRKGGKLPEEVMHLYGPIPATHPGGGDIQTTPFAGKVSPI